MDNLSTPEIILLVVVGYLAIMVLTRMMISHRTQLTTRLREDFQHEQQRKAKEDKQKAILAKKNNNDQSKAA